MFMAPTISQKIDAYAQANLKALKQEEAKTGRKMTKFDIAQHMLQHGKLNKNEYANWMNTTEGFNAQAMTQQQKTALRQGNVWGFAGYGGGEESYLDSMTSFAQKNPVEKQNAIFHRQMKLNETVADRKKKAAELYKQIQEQKAINPKKALEEQKFKAHIDSVKVSEEDKNKTAIELSKELENKEKLNNAINDVKDFAENATKEILHIAGAPISGAIDVIAISLEDNLYAPEEVTQNTELYFGYKNMNPKEMIGELEKQQKQIQNEIADLEQTIAKYEKNMPTTFAEYKQREKNEEFLSDIPDDAKLSGYKDGNYSEIKEALSQNLQWCKDKLQQRLSDNTDLGQAIYELEMGEQNKTLTPKEQVEFAEKYHLEKE